MCKQNIECFKTPEIRRYNILVFQAAAYLLITVTY